jgi:hypothetical protein
MDLKSICLFVALKHDRVQPICGEINGVLDEHMIGSSTVTQHLRLVRFETVPVDAPQTRQASGRRLSRNSDWFGKTPFSSSCEFARATCFSVTTVYRHFTQPLSVTVPRLRWVPQGLTDREKPQRVDPSRR